MIQVTQVFGAEGTAPFDVVVQPELPAVVTNNQIVVLRAVQPTQIMMDSVRPASTAPDAVWIETAKADVYVTYGSGTTYLRTRLQSAQYYDGTGWTRSTAYVGVDGAWVQFSSRITMMGARAYNATKSSSLERLGAAIGKLAVAGIGPVAQQSDFDEMPIYKDIKTCTLSDTGAVLAWKGDAGFSWTANNVMVRIPKFWYKMTSDKEHDEWWISDGPAAGFEVHPAFARPTLHTDMDAIYVSAFEASTDGATYLSKAEAAATQIPLRSTARVNARNKGAGWYIPDSAVWAAVNMLMMVEYATLNFQGAIGPGVCKAAAVAATGSTANMAGHTGRPAGAAANQLSVKWRDIENWWGNYSCWMDGLNASNETILYSSDPGNYSDNIGPTSGYNVASYAYASTGFNATARTATCGFDAACPWLRVPIKDGGSATSGYCDGLITNTGSLAHAFGGYYVSDAGAGPFCMHNFAYSATSVYSGTRLIYLPPKA